MTQYQTLPTSAQVAYADLLTSLIAAPFPGKGISYFTRRVKGKKYWYLQYTIGASKRSHYIGPDNEQNAEQINQAKQLLENDIPDQKDRQRLVSTGLAAGLKAPSITEGRVMQALVQSGLFEAGSVLVGSHAFITIGNMLGVNWTSDAGRTEDIDIAQGNLIVVATPNDEINLIEKLRDADRGFFPVPALNRKEPSTSFKIRNQKLSVSLLSPEIGKHKKGAVFIPGLNVATEPVRFLDYIIDDSQLAAIPIGAGLLIRVPNPARFALHKLVVSQRRPAAMAAKSRKDILQANLVLDVLKDLRPGDVIVAAEAAHEMGSKFIQQLKRSSKLLDKEIYSFIKEVFDEQIK